MSRTLFSSETEEWSTPKWLYDQLNAEFHFTLDPCTTDDNPLGTIRFYTLKEDGLNKKWMNTVFVNPPYNTEINEWLYKADQELRYNPRVETIVFLLPARTDTRWFHKYIYDVETNEYRINLRYNVEVRFIKGRLKFGNAKHPAPFPSMIVIFRQQW